MTSIQKKAKENQVSELLVNSIEFIEDGHLYLYDGVLSPSVSQILQFINPNKYKGIPQQILSAKAQFGTNVHKAIENHEQGIDNDLSMMEQLTFEKYLELREEHEIRPVVQEQLVSYYGRYCGTLDMVADVKYYRCLVDIKTTAQVDVESLAWQLGMYKLAYEEMYGVKLHTCYCLWLPKKGLGKLIEIIPKTKKQIEEMLDQYEEHNSEQ